MYLLCRLERHLKEFSRLAVIERWLVTVKCDVVSFNNCASKKSCSQHLFIIAEKERMQRAAFLANSVVKTMSPLHSREASVHREDFIDAVIQENEQATKQSHQQPDSKLQESEVMNFTELDQVVEALSKENASLPELHPPSAANNRLSSQAPVLTPSIPSYPSSSVSPQSVSPRPTSPVSVDYGQVIGSYVALYAYEANNDDELDLMPGDVVKVVETCDDGWYVGTCQRTGVFGTFPGNYVSLSNT